MVERVGAFEEGTCPVRTGFDEVAGEIDTIDDCIGPLKLSFAAIEEGSGPVGVGLAGADGEMEMTEDGMMPDKVSAGGEVCVDAAIDEGSGPLAEVELADAALAEAEGRANSARKNQLRPRANARIAAASAPSSVKSSTSSYSSDESQPVRTQITSIHG